MNTQDLGALIEHSLLKPTTTAMQVREVCREAREAGVSTLFVAPVHVVTAVRELSGAATRVGTVVGFPLGLNSPEIKTEEAVRAAAQGAECLDLVIHTGALKEGNHLSVIREIQDIVRAGAGATLTVIMEGALLTEAEKIRVCEMCREAGADFVQTATGNGPGGATVEDILLLKKHAGPVVGVVAAGGIRDLDRALSMISAGADRIGSSQGLRILRQWKERQLSGGPAGIETAVSEPAPEATV